MAVGKRGRAAVVVLGDLGRSPRMQYHALSLATQAGMEVDVVAHAGTEPHPALLEDPRIHLHLIKPPTPLGLPRSLYLLVLPLKIVIHTIHLIWMLCIKLPAPDVILVQNPPAIPTLLVVKWACWIHKAAYIIDWHNFGYTLLGLKLGPGHLLVKIHHWYERHYGKMADGYLCVTEAMQLELAQNWGIWATVLYDRSPEFFHPATLKEKHQLFCRLNDAITRPDALVDCCCSDPALLQSQHSEENSIVNYQSSEIVGSLTTGMCSSDLEKQILYPQKFEVGSNNEKVGVNVDLKQLENDASNLEYTLFTCRLINKKKFQKETEEKQKEHYFYRENRPVLIVSSTSWTPDEDFSILLEAAVMYDRRVAAHLGELDTDFPDYLRTPENTCPYPRLMFIVTGKGPMRSIYEERIRKLRLRRVAFRTMWLSANDYPVLLGSADLGVCLHTSSSGLDLPMKVVDMFGCGLPVCAVSYSCIGELVKDRQNGLLFSSSSELALQLLELFKGFPKDNATLSALRDGALSSGSSTRWKDEWEENVMPLLFKVCQSEHS
ncbi:hypothetical protein O6H91_01G137900 [Diphasiastrum complanatum]|uniref:Uncharacterized protein n=4 Tax=Diphasiastrum complanatum TaxID=34168 RepID=A0ACC2EWQ2_DIPCM|nr:hypothetical protein O6H91_01G137900 [Diphasiastrum complanatum]KAJ7570887.1 hypothetical protein O6H91_01G137900 [Diphasiastrum complanatum]KAJ7570888.1 hypothetical protein O6H91_01G137900 [Diphasiastrum complanatum]